ncbi:MAG: M1 family metallopeptidase [Euryarchaeota archaeon]|nr:M1 family metallopeptidase [Euryarchaeota archaeon]
MKVHRYEVAFDVDHAKLTYSGKVALHLDHDGGPLTLNSVGLDIDGVSSGGSQLSHELVPTKEELKIEGVSRGKVAVEVAFHAKVPENALTGIYRTDYGATHAIVTQLEPLGARHVLPCIDHPAQKAEFHVEVTTDAGLQVIFNTPAKAHEEKGGRVHYVFEPTPRMSTYLLFLGIGKFEECSRKHGKTEIIVAAPPGRGDQAGFALDHSGKVLDFFGEYFGLPFPLPKLHLIAIPNIAVGGMENWGAIAFRERALLVGPDASQSTKRQVMGVLAHEIAHQWFGDLVTMAWWNDLWLNESFATFMDYKATSHLYPDWQVWSDFAVGSSNALLWDALPHSHPVNVPVEDPNEINSIFDEISYAKGGSILRMLEAYLGEEVFRTGVARYLKKFSYGNAKGEDLWAALDEEAKEPVSVILGDWLNRPGYPALRAEVKGEELELAQKRFFLTPPENGGKHDTTWSIPLNVLADGKAVGHLMRGTTLKLPLHDPNTLVLNHGRRSFLRIRYEGKLGTSIRQRFPSLAPWDRYGLLQDTYAFLLAGEVDPPTYLELVRAAKSESDYLVLNELGSEGGILFPVLRDRPSFFDALRGTVVAQSDRLGLSARAGEPSHNAVLRQRMSSFRVQLEPSFAEAMASRFTDWESSDPSLRQAIAVAYARTRGAAVFDEILHRLQNSKTDEEKGRLAHALGAFTDRVALERSVALPFSGQVNPTTGLEVLVSLLQNVDAHDVMWEAFQQFFPVIVQNFGGTGIVPILLQWSVPYLGLGREKEIKTYFETNPVGEGQSGLTKGMDLLAIYSGLQRRFPA